MTLTGKLLMQNLVSFDLKLIVICYIICVLRLLLLLTKSFLFTDILRHLRNPESKYKVSRTLLHQKRLHPYLIFKSSFEQKILGQKF